MENKCEICKTKMRPIYLNMSKKEQTRFYRCPVCKLIWAPELIVSETFSSKLNEKNRKSALQNIRRDEFKQVNILVKRYVPQKGRGLDVGCAYGWYMKSVGSDFAMEGIEPEKVVAQKAREGGNMVYTGYFPGDMPKDVGKYDFLVFNNVWEHINHTSKLIEDSLSFLKQRGIMVITVPLSTGGLYRISELFETIGRTKELSRLWQLHFHSPHIYYFTKSNLVEIMDRYHCKLLECQEVRGIDPKRMKERFEMDSDEQYGNLKAKVFQIVYPVLKHLSADKAIFVFQYEGKER